MQRLVLVDAELWEALDPDARARVAHAVVGTSSFAVVDDSPMDLLYRDHLRGLADGVATAVDAGGWW